MKKLKQNLKATLVFALLASVFLSTTLQSALLPAQPKRVIDDETVYAIFDSQGKPTKTIVVGWLRVEGNGFLEIIDRGEAYRVEALKDEVKPEIKNNLIIWKINVNKSKDFFYRAETKRELPIDLSITYYLDGEKLPAEKIAGKSGHLKIEISLKNKVKKKVKVSYLSSDEKSFKESKEEIYLPLLAIVNLDLKATKFRNIETKNSMLSVSGETLKYTWMLFPQPEATASIEMDGENIETDPLIISVLPQMPETPEVEFEDEFEKLKEGLEKLSLLSSVQAGILKEVANKFDTSRFDKFSQASEGLILLSEGIKKTREGTSGLIELMNAQLITLKTIIDNIDTGQFENLPELTSGLEQLLSGFQSSKQGIDDLLNLIDSQISALDGIKDSNDYLISLARETTSTELVDGLESQGEIINALISGGDIPGQGYLPGLRETRSNLQQISEGLADLISGLQEICEQAAFLNQVPEAFTSLKNSLQSLKDGGSLNGSYLPGLSFTLQGLQGISHGLKQMETGLSEMNNEMSTLEDLPASIVELKSGLTALAEGGYLQGHFLPGLTTVKDALNQTSKGLGEGLEEMRRGKAIKEAMEREAEKYDTFLGKPNGAQGRVRFIFKIKGIEK